MSITKSKQPRKQRKAQAQAPAHMARKLIASHLAEDLIIKYNRRAIPVVLGDTVKVLRGNYKGHTGKVAEVEVSRRRVVIEGLTALKADGTKVPRGLDPSNLVITKLNMADPRRREKLLSGFEGEDKTKVLAEMESQAEKDKAAAEAARQEVEEMRKAAHAAAEAREHEHDHDHEDEAEHMAEDEDVPETPTAPAEEKEAPEAAEEPGREAEDEKKSVSKSPDTKDENQEA